MKDFISNIDIFKGMQYSSEAVAELVKKIEDEVNSRPSELMNIKEKKSKLCVDILKLISVFEEYTNTLVGECDITTRTINNGVKNGEVEFILHDRKINIELKL